MDVLFNSFVLSTSIQMLESMIGCLTKAMCQKPKSEVRNAAQLSKGRIYVELLVHAVGRLPEEPHWGVWI